MLVLTT